MVVATILPLSSLSQETALECHFGTDRTFEARWLNSSAVECVHVLVSRGVRLPAPVPPTAWVRSKAREGLAPSLLPSSWDATSPPPSLCFQLKKVQIRFAPLARGSLRMLML